MSGVQGGTRLERLYALRTRINQEIAVEEYKAACGESGLVSPNRMRMAMSFEPGTIKERLARHGLTAHEVKEWAVAAGLMKKVCRGQVSALTLDSYLEHHQEAV